MVEQYLDLHQTESLQNLNITSMFLEQDQHVWYQWLCERKKGSIIFWSIFTNKLITHYGDIKRNIF